MTTDVDVLNACLARLGAAPVEGRTDPAAMAAWAVYDAVTAVVLGGYQWTFQRRTRELDRLAAPPECQWTYAFQVPHDMAGNPRAVYADQSQRVPVAGWERAGMAIHSDSPRLWLRYNVRAAEAYWPPLVAEAIRIGVMAELALTIREDGKLREALRQQAFGTPGEAGSGGLLGQAMAQDAMSEPPPTIGMGSNPLIDCRR